MSKLFDLNGGVETSPLKETDGMYVVSTDANGQPVASGFTTLSGLKTSLGLGTAASGTLTTSRTDAELGRVLKVGDFGIGVGETLTPHNYNTLTNQGVYLAAARQSGSTNAPAAGAYFVHVSHGLSGGSLRVYQEAVSYTGAPGARYFRRGYDGTDWTTWEELFHSASIVPVENGGTNAMNALDARANLGLGTSATQTVVTGTGDTTTTHIPTVGWVQANTVSVVEVPATPTSSGEAGQIALDNNYAYFCTDTDTWIRVEKDATWV